MNVELPCCPAAGVISELLFPDARCLVGRRDGDGTPRFSERTLRLIACGWVRAAAYLLDERQLGLLDALEQRADHLADGPQPVEFMHSARGPRRTRLRAEAAEALFFAQFQPWTALDDVLRHVRRATAGQPAEARERTLRGVAEDVLGPPCRLPTGLNPDWLSANGGTAGELAAAAYQARAFDLFSILADALEDAAFTDTALLAHLRGPGTHHRGCWALDFLLGRG